jgi:hypothetical protein
MLSRLCRSRPAWAWCPQPVAPFTHSYASKGCLARALLLTRRFGSLHNFKPLACCATFTPLQQSLSVSLFRQCLTSVQSMTSGTLAVQNGSTLQDCGLRLRDRQAPYLHLLHIAEVSPSRRHGGIRPRCVRKSCRMLEVQSCCRSD